MAAVGLCHKSNCTQNKNFATNSEVFWMNIFLTPCFFLLKQVKNQLSVVRFCAKFTKVSDNSVSSCKAGVASESTLAWWSATPETSFTAAVIIPTEPWIPLRMVSISSVASEVVLASFLTSSATTEKLLPCAPERAASITAFRPIKLVSLAILPMVLTILSLSRTCVVVC